MALNFFNTIFPRNFHPQFLKFIQFVTTLRVSFQWHGSGFALREPAPMPPKGEVDTVSRGNLFDPAGVSCWKRERPVHAFFQYAPHGH